MNYMNLKPPLKQAHIKPDKPEDREESWLRKMANRLPSRRSQVLVKAETEEEVESELVGPTDSSPRKPKKKRKKEDGGCIWWLFLVFVLAGYGAAKILASLFG